VDSLFGAPEIAPPANPMRSAGSGSAWIGPSYVRFFFVAGSRDELQSLRRAVDAYGSAQGPTWLPYFPAVERSASALSQEIAARLNMTSFPEQLTAATAEEFTAQLRVAQQNGNVVVLLVDTWSLCLDRYLTLMQQYDGVDLWNTAVLVVWNKGDQETVAAQSRLQRRVDLAFVAKRNRNDPYAYPETNSPTEFSEGLCEMLARAQLKVVDITQQIARAEGDTFIPRPIVSGPALR
jgi:FxsC-like protein